ncbi:hypothetical protein B566_EDAN002046 [Ephemera danica]|nr:hypothetical protein B566_EDAN002046 [Ephemera danica]
MYFLLLLLNKPTFIFLQFMNGWQIDEQFLTDYMHGAFETDAQVNTHPIYATVDSPNSISNIFDRITYSKGGCIVRFMVNFLGESSFMAGIDNYFNIKAFTAADQSELFNVLGLYAPPIPNGLTFVQMMDTWTKQAGFPLVTVTRDYNAHTATIKQERFGSIASEEWVIPLTMTTSAAPNYDSQSAQAWLLPGAGSITLQDPLVPSSLQWMMLNIRRSVEREHLLDFLEDLMNDALALARVGRLNYNTALRTTAYLDLETRLTPWVTATDDLEYVRDRMYQTAEGVQLFQSYMRSKLDTVYAEVNGFVQGVGDTHAKILTRWTATRWNCDMNDDSCNSEGVAIFRQWQQEANPDVNNPVIPDLRTPVYCAGQRRGGEADFDFLMARYKNAPVYSDESVRLLNAMGCASDTTILLNLLTASLNPLDVAPGDSIRALRSVTYNPLGADLGLDFVIANWVQLDSLYGNIGNGFLTLADVLNTQEHYNKILQFRNEHSSELSLGALTGIQSTLNILEENMAWNFAYLSVVMEYFRIA